MTDNTYVSAADLLDTALWALTTKSMAAAIDVIERGQAAERERGRAEERERIEQAVNAIRADCPNDLFPTWPAVVGARLACDRIVAAIRGAPVEGDGK